MEIQLSQGYVAQIDICDADLADVKWSACKKPNSRTIYAHRSIPVGNGKQTTQRLHRVILGRILGRELLPGEEVDHIDRNGLNNRRENLRLATRSQNQRNVVALKTNRSGYKGVCYHKGAGKWRAEIQVDHKKLHLGLFDTPEEAGTAYVDAAKKYHGEFASVG